VDVQPTLEADTQLAKAGKPRVGSPHHTAMFTQALAAFDAPPGNPASYAMAAQVRSESRVFIAVVRMQLRGPAPRPSAQSLDCWECIDALFEHHGVVPIDATAQHHQRNTPGVYDDVPLGAELASISGVGACFLAPRGRGTDEPSILARLQ
jgi:hypothetical protein